MANLKEIKRRIRSVKKTRQITSAMKLVAGAKLRKATEAAKKSMVRIPLKEGRTLHHDVEGRFGAGKVVFRTAPPGTGIIAGGPSRAVMEALGVADVVAKSNGTSNPYNLVRATIDALQRTQSPRQVAQRRGIKVADVLQIADQGEEAMAEA